MSLKPVGLGRVLVVDDEKALADMLADMLTDAGYDVRVAHSVGEAKALIAQREFDVALLDMHLQDGTGEDVLLRLSDEGAPTEAIMLTGDRDVTSAVHAMKLGASDYLVKPATLTDVELAVGQARERRRLRAENRSLRVRLARHETRSKIVAEDPDFRSLIASLDQVGPSDLPVIVQGESGTGKEMIARAIHDASRHRMEPFAVFDCRGRDDDRAERDLFGYERGAFVGALERTPGACEVADRGTLFLDEVGELSAALQSKLLRALDAQEFCRVGSTRPVLLRARLVSGSVRDLNDLVATGEFRKDLHDRINGVTIRLKPLRDRPADILPLALHFMEGHQIRRSLSPRALESLKAHSWRGNVRELRMAIQRSAVHATGEMIEPRDLPLER